MCVGSRGMDLELGLGAVCPSGIGHLNCVVCFLDLGCLRVAQECRYLGVWVSVSL